MAFPRVGDANHPWSAPVAVYPQRLDHGVVGGPLDHRHSDVVLAVAIPGVSAARVVAALVRALFSIGGMDGRHPHLAAGRGVDHAAGHADRGGGGLWTVRVTSSAGPLYVHPLGHTDHRTGDLDRHRRLLHLCANRFGQQPSRAGPGAYHFGAALDPGDRQRGLEKL